MNDNTGPNSHARFHKDRCEKLILVYVDLPNHEKKEGSVVGYPSSLTGSFHGCQKVGIVNAEGSGIVIDDQNVFHAAPKHDAEAIAGKRVTRVLFHITFNDGQEIDYD